jgi:hypothetical protein
MTSSSPSRTWVAAGVLLIIATLLPLVIRQAAIMTPIPGFDGFEALLLGSAFVLLAFGTPSVVARRPLGMTALVGLAVWNVGVAVLWMAGSHLVQAWGQTFSVVIDTVWIALAVIASISIARAGVVRRPWRYAPLWGVVAVVVPQVVVYALSVSPTTVDTATALAPIALILTVAAPVFLGVLAIVLGVTRTVAAETASDEPIFAGVRPEDPA